MLVCDYCASRMGGIKILIIVLKCKDKRLIQFLEKTTVDTDVMLPLLNSLPECTQTTCSRLCVPHCYLLTLLVSPAPLVPGVLFLFIIFTLPSIVGLVGI